MRPTTPQNDAGWRSEPPMSDPSASGTMPEARAAANAVTASNDEDGVARMVLRLLEGEAP